MVQDAIEERQVLSEQTNDFVTADLSSPNPNSEFDNLYIDMNGVVHPCCHPEDCSAPETEDEMFQVNYSQKVFRDTDCECSSPLGKDRTNESYSIILYS